MFSGGKIAQYTKFGKLIKTWNSIQEAAVALNIKEPIIKSICDEENQILIEGFIWKRYFTQPKKNIKTKYYPILQFDSNRTFIKEWDCDWNDIIKHFGSKPPYSLNKSDIVVAWGYYWKQGNKPHRKSYKELKSNQTMKKNKKKYICQYIQYNTNRQIVQTWDDYKEIKAKYPKMTKGTLEKACKDKTKEYCGYVWRKRRKLVKS